MPSPLSAASIAALCMAFTCCAHGPKIYTKRLIETPAGEREVPGPVRTTRYAARVSMEHNIAHISVLETSQCPVIKMRVVNRIEETLDGDRVVERVDKGSQEKSELQPSLMECETRLSRVRVDLQYGANTYPLGSTNEVGSLDVDLARAMKTNTRDTDLSNQTGLLLVGGMPNIEISMAGLLQQQQRLDELISHLSLLLGKERTKLTEADMTNASMLYEEMRELAPDDARTVALTRRYVEVVGGFRDVQQTASLKRNLAALSEAKELVAALGSKAAIPAYVQVSVSNDGPTADAIAWARAQAIVSLRSNQALCAGGFDWSRIEGLSERQRLAFTYLRYALADDTGWLTTACAQ